MITSPERKSRCWVLSAAIMLPLAVLAPKASAERPSAPRLLPETTVALLRVVDAPEMAEKFMNTATGRISQDPQLKPLLGQIYGSLTEALSEVEQRVGLSLPELLAIPQGELAVALVAPEERPLAVVLLLDAGGQLSNARKLLERGTAELDRSNAARSEETVAGTKFVIYDGVGPRRRKAIYFEKDATIVIGSDLDVLKQLLAVWNGGGGDTLTDNRDYAAIMHRCRGSKDEPPQLVWYANPVEIMRKVGDDIAGVRVAVALLPALGLDGLTAVGGSLILDTAQFDSVMHAHLLLESPRSGVIKMIALESGEMEPEPWVPVDVASYSTFHWDIERTYATLAKLYDSFRGEGAFGRALERRIFGPTGIDLEKDIVQSLEGRVTMVNRIQRPVTLQSSAMLLGLKLKDSRPFGSRLPSAADGMVERALEKVVKLSEGNLVERTSAGKKYYQVRMPPQLSELPPEQRPPMPCFGVLDGYLLAANQAGIYEKAVTTAADASQSLADELDFKLVASKIKRQPGGDRPAMITFNRPEEGMRFLYELAISERTRQQLRRQAENNPFFRSIEKALDDNPLPPFAVLQQYMAPGGAMLVDDETGIHYMTFSLRRKSD